MGSCSEDCKVEGESVTLGDRDGDQSLVELEDNVAKQVDLRSGKEFIEEVVSLNNICGGVNIGEDCVELVTGVKEAETKNIGVMGADSESGHLELEKTAYVSMLKNDFEGLDPCSDRNLLVDLEGNESKQVNLEREDGERERESGYLESDKAFGEEVGSSSNKDSVAYYENINVSKDCNNGVSAHTSVFMNNPVSLDSGSGSEESASGKNEVENECLEDFGSDEEIEHFGLQKDSTSVSEQDHDEFPGLSPLRTLGRGDFACSVFGMGSEVGLLPSEVFDSDGIRNGCDDADILVSSGLAADCSLLRIDKDAYKAVDGHCCPHDDSREFEASCMVERCEKLYSFGNEKVGFSQSSEADNKGRTNSKSNPIVVFRRSNPKRSASLRSNLADGKYNQPSIGNNRRNGKKAVHISPASLLSMIKISNKLKRKRSSHRLARQSLWGPVETLTKIFEQNARFVDRDAAKIHVRNKRLKKGMPIECSKKQAKSQKDGKICASFANHFATSDKVEVKHKWSGKMGKGVRKSDNRCSTERTQTVDTSVDASDYTCLSSGALNLPLMMSTQQNCNRAVLKDVSSLVVTSAGDQLIPNDPKASLEQPLPPQVAWVLCDDCEKWRCISVELANTLEETKCKWTCKDNKDEAFSDCLIPQEKTNAEINAELGILDDEDPSSVEANANGVEPLKLVASKRTSWIPIKSNVFLHRNRKTQTIDEIMVCHCKPPQDGRRGCGDQCLNRMLNIECAKGTCPCGDLCSNQRFQKRKYAKFKLLRCGKKGYGLQLQQDVSQGQFLIEYVGEVLDLATYDARQRYYASQGQKHFYFMALNGGEVIDACAKGNLGRHINHSCEPNCCTEKWMVNGEVCIGLFAIRDIKKGEEVTFDYNYVRVVGAAAKKCICGSSECRGYLGGDPLNSEIIVQSDSDEEDNEPLMIHEKGQKEFNSISYANDVKISKNKENLLEREEIVIMHPPAIPEPMVCAQNDRAACRARSEVIPLDTCLRSLDPKQAEDIVSRPDTQPVGDSKLSLNSAPVEESVCKPISDIQPQDISVGPSTSMNAVLSDSVLNKQKAVTYFSVEKPNISKPLSLTKSVHSRDTIKRGRSNVKNMVSVKPKTFAADVDSGQFEGVEAKLNELLEKDGGISRQQDATKGYLKLLVVTAAEGDVGGCASQSSRDLSLILDAILKTKSRKVLVDIINKNGLQMLHNIMMQNRDNFNRIPILRKLLKVLEFLAFTKILTPELINNDPPCSGKESFKVSILKLAKHSDKQVHKIAREFRDKWFPRHIKRIKPSDRDSVQLDRQILHHNCCIRPPIVECPQADAARDTDAIVIVGSTDHRSASSSELDNPEGTPSSYNSCHQVSSSALSVIDDNTSSASGTKTRKRKSRWDHPLPDRNFEEPGPWMFSKHVPDLHDVVVDRNGCQDLMQLDYDDGRPPGFFEHDDDGPPGFQKNHPSHNQASTQTAVVTAGEVIVMGHPQEVYFSHMTVSYGIPVALMQQLGDPGTGESPHQNWAIAPGMPFHPFPPLPSYPRKPARQQIDTDLGHPSPSVGGMAETNITGSWNSTCSGRGSRFPNTRGRGTRFPNAQRWDNNNRWRRHESCWPRGSNQSRGRGGFRGGGNIRNRVRNVRGNFGQGLCPDGVNINDANPGFHQPHR